MKNITEDFLLLKSNIKDFDTALAKGDIVALKNIANLLVMNTENLLLEVSHYANKS